MPMECESKPPAAQQLDLRHGELTHLCIFGDISNVAAGRSNLRTVARI